MKLPRLWSLPMLIDQTNISYYNHFTGVCEAKHLHLLKGWAHGFSSEWLKMPQKLAFSLTCIMILVSYSVIWK